MRPPPLRVRTVPAPARHVGPARRRPAARRRESRRRAAAGAEGRPGARRTRPCREPRARVPDAIDPSATRPGPDDDPLLRTPSIRPIARPLQSAALRAADPTAHSTAASRDDRQAQPELRPGVDHAVDPDGGQEEPDPRGPDGERCCRAAGVAPSPVPSGIHRGGQLQRAVERTLQDRHCDAAQTSKAVSWGCRAGAGPAHGRDRLDQLRGERESHGDRDARFVQHRRKAAEETVGADQ